MPFRYFLVLTIGIYATCSFPVNSEEVDADNYDQLTEQSCMGSRALIDLERGYPVWFCEDFYRQKSWLKSD